MPRYLFWLFLLSLPVWCNMAAPWRSGDSVGEPSADLRGMTVQSEALRLDLRPLGQLKNAQDRAFVLVEATYQILRKGSPKSVELVFVAPGQDGHAEVWLDDRPQTFAVEKAGALPQPWRSPATTPRAGGGPTLTFEPFQPEQVLRFRLLFTPGKHTVRVKYELRPTAVCSQSPLRYWQLAYVLAPARQWTDFGALDAEILIPEGWRLATSLPMEPNGPAYRGHWQGVPADFLALSAQAPVPPRWPVIETVAGLCLFVPLGMAWGVGDWLGRRGRSLWWSLVFALGLASLSMAAFLGLGFAVLEALPSYPPAQVSWNWSYGQTVGVLFGSLPLGVVAWVSVQFTMLLAARKARSVGPARV